MPSNSIASGKLPTPTRFVGALQNESDVMQKERERDMEAVAKHYAETGAVYASCDVAGIKAQTYYRWLREDIRFQEMMKEAHQRHLEKWEGRAARIAQKNEESNNPNPIMTIFTLKALAPQKYGDKIRVEDTRLDTLLESLAEHRKLVQREQAQLVEGQVVEGEGEADEASST